MRLYPYECALLSLSNRHFAFHKWLGSKEQAYEMLKEISGKDFGDDVKAWAEWGLENRRITQLRKSSVRSALGIPTSKTVSDWLIENRDNKKSLGQEIGE